MRPKKQENSTTENRTRPVQVKIRMTDKEYAAFNKQLKATGMTAQDFILHAIKNAPIIDADSKELILDVHKAIKDIQLQAKGMGINVNQMAKVANTTGALPKEAEFKELSIEILNTGKEVGQICLLLNPLIQKQTPSQD